MCSTRLLLFLIGYEFIFCYISLSWLFIFVSICFVSVISNLYDLVNKEYNTIQYNCSKGF